MEVSGIGGIGLSAGAGIGVGGAPSANTVSPGTADAIAKSAPPPQSVAEYYAGAQSPNIQEALSQLESFSMAELIIALMILAAGGQGKEEESGSSSALDFLAGMAVGSQLFQQSHLFQPSTPQNTSATPSIGQSLDISA